MIMLRNDFIKLTGTLIAGGYLSNGLISPFLNKSETIKPPALNPGDTIGFISPAGILYDEMQFEVMQKAMESMGLQVRFGKNAKNRFGYLAGRDNERASDLNEFFKDPDIKGIVTVRGGWGSNRILPLIDFENIRNNPKFFCGFSDITSLHLSIYRNTGLTTFHGPNGSSDWTLFTKNHFRKMAFGEDDDLVLSNPPNERLDIQTIHPGIAKGTLLGGNLTLVTSLLGSDYMPDFDGSLLFLEDIGEDIYKVDRMMSQLQLSGVLNKINGFIFGKCFNCSESKPGSLTLMQVLNHYLKPFEIPAFYGSMISHEPNNFTIPVGVEAEINADNGDIKLLEKPVLV